MKKTMTTWEIADALKRDEYAGWSYEGAKALAEYLEEYEESCGVELEFDPVAIRCDFSEYENAIDAAKKYGWEDEQGAENDEAIALEWLEEQTSVICFKGGVIIQNF